MNFLNPLVLFGLIAAGIPILLHLLNLRRMKKVEFSTLRFIKELQKTKIRRLKLKQILLLILRTLLIILIVLAFARPTIESKLPVFKSYSKTSAVILLDNSFSMDVSDELGNRFFQAKKIAGEILNRFGDGDEAALIPLAGELNRNDYSMTRNLELVRERLNNTNLSATRSDLKSGIRLASSLLGESANLNKDIYIISDGQNNLIRNDEGDSLRIIPNDAGILVFRIGEGSSAEILNYSIDSVRLVSSIFQRGRQVETEANIRNYSDKKLNDIVTSLIVNGERVSQRAVTLDAGANTTSYLAYTPKEQGPVSAEINIEEDALDWDNKRFLGFVIPDKPRIALVGSNTDIAFIKTALESGENESYANLSIFKPEQFPGIRDDEYDLLILAAGPFNQSDFVKLENFVNNGGSALLFADTATPADILKNGIESLGFGEIQKTDFLPKEPVKFSSVDKLHPLFENVFRGSTNKKKIVESPDIVSAMPVNGGRGVIEMPGGNFLSESRLGDGKTLFIAVPPYPGPSNFPFTGIFPTLMYRSVIYLSASEETAKTITAGEKLSLSIQKKYRGNSNFRITGPGGKEKYIQGVDLPSGTVINFGNMEETGVFRVVNSQDKTAAMIVVNPPPDESDITNISDASFEKLLFKVLDENTPIEFIGIRTDITEEIVRARTGTELWQLAVIFALLCAVAEMLVARASKNEAE